MADSVTRYGIKWWQAGLDDLSDEQWEQLCDGCGLCCLHKLEDEDTGEFHYTRLACNLLNTKTCECGDYANRFKKVPECLQLTPSNYSEMLPWLPGSCAYKRVAEGKSLADWHHLIAGDKTKMHRLGLSVSCKVRHAKGIAENDYQDHLLHWVDCE
ncbi:MAG: YcgN family cysteine cluster protein [Marinagarivorans sp.]|nr:YcgN family cysteine cluster protein [Marinagarivorans sp.]